MYERDTMESSINDDITSRKSFFKKYFKTVCCERSEHIQK